MSAITTMNKETAHFFWLIIQTRFLIKTRCTNSPSINHNLSKGRANWNVSLVLVNLASPPTPEMSPSSGYPLPCTSPPTPTRDDPHHTRLTWRGGGPRAAPSHQRQRRSERAISHSRAAVESGSNSSCGPEQQVTWSAAAAMTGTTMEHQRVSAMSRDLCFFWLSFLAVAIIKFG